MGMASSLSSHTLPFYGHYTSHQHHPLQHKLFFFNLNPESNALSVFRRFQKNDPLSPHFSVNRCQTSTDTRGFSKTKPVIDVPSANIMVREYAVNGFYEDAIRVYLNLLECGGFLVEECRFFPCLVKAFGGLCEVGKGKEIHGHLIKLGFLADIYVCNSLLAMYWKCGAGEMALKMFEKMSERDLISWNTMVSGFCQSGDFGDSLNFFSRMIKEFGATVLTRVAYLSALSSCASMGSLTDGQAIHGFLVKSGLDSDEFLVSGLIEMYMKCNNVKNAEFVFRSIVDKELIRGNPVVWNVMILGYVFNKYLLLSLDLFVEMLGLGINPDSATVVAVLVLCSELLDVTVGKQIHRIVVGFGLNNDVRVGTALMEMYFKCGDPEAGLKLFRRYQNYNLVMWGLVISNCAQNGCPNEALQLFCEFMINYGFPDTVILLSALRACSTLALKPVGMGVHGLAVKLGFVSDVFVGGALVDLYGECGDMESAKEVFCQLPTKDLVSWNALISGFAQNEHAEDALKSFHDMQSDCMKPNAVTLACVLSVCAHLSIMILCKEVHCYLLRHGLESNILVSNSLVSAYAKCGDMNSSWTIFDKMPARTEVSWNSIILGFGMHNRADEMFALFEKMKDAGMKPDHATFTALLSACSHAGMIEMAWEYFRSMTEGYNLEPRVEQYTCMVDLLGRAGHLNQAYNLIRNMPCLPDNRIWGSLLASCKKHGDTKLAEVVANHIFELDPTSIGYRVLLANLYEEYGKWNEVIRVRSEIKDVGLMKQPGCSWIEVNNNIHIFTAGDCSHAQYVEIYNTIDNLTIEMKKAGHIPSLQSASIGADEAKDDLVLSE